MGLPRVQAACRARLLRRYRARVHGRSNPSWLSPTIFRGGASCVSSSTIGSPRTAGHCPMELPIVPDTAAVIWSPEQATKQMIRLDFGRGVTNNEVEYRTLITTLKDLVGRIHRAGKPPSATETEPDPLVGISLFFFPSSPVTPTPHGQPLDFGGGTHSAADEVWCSAWNACSGGQLAGPPSITGARGRRHHDA